MLACSASPPRRRQVAFVLMAIENHVGRIEYDERVRVGRHVVQKVIYFLHRVLCWRCLH